MLPSYVGIILNYCKNPVIKQPGFNGKYPMVFGTWLNYIISFTTQGFLLLIFVSFCDGIPTFLCQVAKDCLANLWFIVPYTCCSHFEFSSG